MINIAMFGAGRIGSIHGKNVVNHPLANLVALYDPIEENATRLSSQLGCELWTPEQIFTSDLIDAILICSATDTHAEMIERAVESGKDVFCEKPIDLSLDRVMQCCKRVEQGNSKVMIAFNRRFDPNFQALKDHINAGSIGKVEIVTIQSKDPEPPPAQYVGSSGGMFRDMTIHDFDMARFLLSDEIVEVTAQASCLVDPAIGEAGDIDTAVITLSTASGKLVQISNSRRASFGYDQRVEVHGSDGMLIAQNINENSVITYDKAGVHSAKPLLFFLERYDTAYRAELDSFIQNLAGGTGEMPGMLDGLQALLIAEAALISVAEKRAVKLADVVLMFER